MRVSRESLFDSIERALPSRPKALVTAIGVAGIGALAVVDYVTGSQISFSVFYLAPVAYVTWFAGLGPGLAVAAIAAATWGVMDVAAGASYAVWLIPVWNSLVRFGFFAIITWLLTSMRAAHESERELARTDPLTGVANSRTFGEAVAVEIERSRRTGRPFTLAYLDLDRFKVVNDTLGHGAGDQLLRTIAGGVCGELRRIDLCARVGGDEFAVLMPETDEQSATLALDRVMRAVEAVSDVPGVTGHLGVTIGAAVFEGPPSGVDEAIRAADGLMYEGKRQGRGRLLVRGMTTLTD
jgi:diguanylate cyclase (GGDEF)-like protein